VTGAGAEALLQEVFKLDVAPAPGRTVRVVLGLLTSEAAVAVTLARMGEAIFYLVVEPEHGLLALSLLTQRIEAERDVMVCDVSAMYATLAIAGPEAAAAMAPLVSPRIELERFSSDQAIAMDVGYAPARVLRYRARRADVWEIHTPFEYLVGLDELIRKTGKVPDVGFEAFNMLHAGRSTDGARSSENSSATILAASTTLR
jgi:glycine cleavage system aminomethyltransferase T